VIKGNTDASYDANGEKCMTGKKKKRQGKQVEIMTRGGRSILGNWQNMDAPGRVSQRCAGRCHMRVFAEDGGR